jgi:hypothetical protein
MDLFVVPTISFRLLYGLLIVGYDRRQILWFEVTAHPTAEWIANQLTETCGWEQFGNAICAMCCYRTWAITTARALTCP